MTDRPGNTQCDTSAAAAFVHQAYQRLEAEKAKQERREELFDPDEATAPHGYLVLIRYCGKRQPIPLLCTNPLCVPCEKVKAQRRREMWFPVLKEMNYPRFMTLGVKSGSNLDERRKHFQSAFRKLLETRLGKNNLRYYRSAGLCFLQDHLDQEVKAKKITFEESLVELERWEKSIERFIGDQIDYFAENGKWQKVRHIVGEGFASLEVTLTNEGWHVHRHITTDGQFFPWPLLCAIWKKCSGDSFIVDIRSVGKTEKDLRELIKYVTKAWEIPKSKYAEFRSAMKGVKRIWPLGYAKPIEVKHVCPYCGDESCKAITFDQRAYLLESGRMMGMPYKLFELADLYKTRFVIIQRLNGSWDEIPLLDTLAFCAAGEMTRGP